MSEKELPSESEIKILEAAEKVFYKKGKGGTSMQDIADAAGITRTSLNYYYRSKDKLFEAVFKNAMGRFVPNVADIVNNAGSLKEILEQMVETIIDTMIEYPQIPIFVLQELNSDPDRVPQFVKDLGIRPEEIMARFAQEDIAGNISVDPRQIIMNILSLCIFPFAGKPMVQNIMYNGDETAFIEAMKMRKAILPLMIENMLKTQML